MTDDPTEDVTTPADEPNEDVEVIASEIEETREEMTGTVEAIGERLDPANIVQDAKETVREAKPSLKRVLSEVVKSARVLIRVLFPCVTSNKISAPRLTTARAVMELL